MMRVERDGFVLWEAWVDQNNKEAAWVRELQNRASILEQRVARLEGTAPTDQHSYVLEKLYKLGQALELLREMVVAFERNQTDEEMAAELRNIVEGARVLLGREREE